MKISLDDIGQFIGKYSLGRDSNPTNITDSLHFLRIKVPGGFITSEQLRSVAKLTEKYSRGLSEITDRQDIQLHWIKAEDSLNIFSIMEDLGFTTDMCGQGFGGARYGDARNIVCCPATGVDKNEIFNGRPLLEKLTKKLIGNPDFLDMPKKFKFSLSGCGSNCTRAEINDLAFVAVKRNDEVGFTILLGGSAGHTLPGPRLAQPTGVFINTEEAYDVAISALEIHRDNSNRESKAKARFKWLIDQWGLEKIINMLEEKLGKPFERYNGPIFLNNNNHEGIKPQSKEGYYYINIPLVGGRLNNKEMILLSDLSDKYGNGELRLTPTQNIIIPDIKEVDSVLKHLEEANMSVKGPMLKWNSIGCSSDFCGKSRSPHAKEILKEIVNHLDTTFDQKILDDAGIRVQINGCPNNCCASNISEIGLSGVLSKIDGEIIQSYDIYLGGSSGQKPTFGRVIEKKVLATKIKDKIKLLLNIYLEDKKSSENFKEFCNRHSEEELITFLNKSER